jgi:predicted DNA-binding transcriptional regulator AlpA
MGQPNQQELSQKALRLKQTAAAAEAVSNLANVPDNYLPARQVWERYGVTSMTLFRWLRNPDMFFPPPVYLGRFRYWKLADLMAWERQMATRRAPMIEAAE